MKQIKILGTGCPKCNKLTESVKQAVEIFGIECTIEKVTDIQEIMKYGVMMTPALVVDDSVRLVGKVPSAEELEKYLV